ncbi:hypothetical protein JCM15415_13530 [Methanobacterium movens]
MEVKPFLAKDKIDRDQKLEEYEVELFLSSLFNQDLKNYSIVESKGNLTIYEKT